MTVDKIRPRVRDVEGWLDDREGELLYRLAKECTKGVVVEIGSWKGKSTIWLAAGSFAGPRIPVYAIDPHNCSYDSVTGELVCGKELTTFSDFTKNIAAAGVQETVRPIVQLSAEAAAGWTEPIGLLWIDGDHSYEGVSCDLSLWLPHVVDGGIVAAHDSFDEHVSRALHEQLYRDPRMEILGIVEVVTYARKNNNPLPWWRRWKTHYLLLVDAVQRTLRSIRWPFRSGLRRIGNAIFFFLRER
jgi:predicted O-methyltransferase YrrM